MVRIEEILGDDCHCVVDYFANLNESSANRFVNTVVRTGHPDRVHTGHNHVVLDSGHRGIGYGHHLIAFGCRCGNGCHRGGNLRHGVDDPVTVVAHYPYYGRIDTHPVVNRCF